MRRKIFRVTGRPSRVTSSIIVLSLLLNGWPAFPVSAETYTNGQAANDVLGQSDANVFPTYSASFARGGVNNGPNRIGVNGPDSVAVDAVNHRLFVSDAGNNRVLEYDLTSGDLLTDTLPDRVLGQSDLNSNGSGATMATMTSPAGLAYDPGGNRLFVADSQNHRVLVFDVASITNGESAAHVLGGGGCQATSSDFCVPMGVAYDDAGDRLFVIDKGNNRVTIFDAGTIVDGESAVNVLGQANFTSGGSATTQAGLFSPLNATYDPTGNRLFVADSKNRRVTVFDVASITNGENAVNVLGQANFTSNSSATTQAGMVTPTGAAFDDAGDRLFVADQVNNRVTVFDVASISDGENAVNVLGQANFTSSGSATTQAGMSAPTGAAFAGAGDRLYVTDQLNNRVTVFDVASITDGENAIEVVGQSDAAAYPAVSPVFTKGGENAGANRIGYSQPWGSVIDPTGHRLFVADQNNNRVLVYDLDAGNAPVDHLPDRVLGQTDFNGNSPALTQNGLDSPWGLAFDDTGDRLFVSDYDNRRVMVFNVASITNGENAVSVLGSSDFTSAPFGASQSSVSGPAGLDYDASTGLLYVAAQANNRVMVFNVASITDGENAVNVLGQTDFISSGAATTQSGLDNPHGVSIDQVNDRLFVTEFNNSRVMVFSVASITNGENAVNVLGQTDFTSAGSGTTQSTFTQASAVEYDSANDRLFVSDYFNNRVMIFDVASISDGENAVNVLGQTDFTSSGSGTTQSAMSAVGSVTHDDTNGILYIADTFNNRVLIFGATSGPDVAFDPTLSNKVTLSRLKVSTSTTVTINFTLQNTLSGPLTVIFPAGFTVTAAANGGASSGCLSSFGFTSSTLTATKTSCSGTITLGGATVTNPATPGAYYISWVNDDPGGGDVYIVDSDQVTVSGTVDPQITFNVGSQAAATACDGTFTGAGGSLGLGTLTTGAVGSSDVSSVPHICTRVTTNASSGAIVTVLSANASLKSTSVPGDTIPSASATLVAGTAGYGICVGSGGGDTGRDATTPTGAAPSATAPFNGSCSTSAHAVGALTTSAQTVRSVSSPSQNAFTRLFLKAAVSPVTPAHNDYADTLTFIATGTY